MNVGWEFIEIRQSVSQVYSFIYIQVPEFWFIIIIIVIIIIIIINAIFISRMELAEFHETEQLSETSRGKERERERRSS